MAERIGERDSALLLDMLIAARDARNFVVDLTESTFLTSRLHQSAVIRSLGVIGEAASKVSPDIQAAAGTIAWRQIIGMRHRLVHDYAGIRLDLVWAVTQERLPSLIVELEKLIPGEGDSIR